MPALNLTLFNASIVWDGCSDVLKLKEIEFSAQKSCKVNLFRYDSNY